MPTKYAIDMATKIIDIVDDYVVISKDGSDIKMHTQLAQFIDDENIAQADSKVDPAEAYSTKIDEIKQHVIDGVTEVLGEI